MDAHPPGSDRLSGLTDAELIAEINDGEESAFEVLYHRHKDWVVNLACRWTGDRELALDVLQETFLYLSKKFPGFVLTARLQTLLYTVVRNLSLGVRRKLDRYETGAAAEAELSLQAAPAHTAGGDALEAVLAGLTPDHREVLLLRFVDGLTLPEISQAMEIPLGTVKSRLHNALAALRNDPRTTKFFNE